ncbi:hypothetical protein A2767_00790 [Candidatus Roizmanbacteria bacterium RIFCSPHIGHO2_01_FULL_35_10]|uniref:Uncharacterized protein n=1 Tax=Candidatus Roizmanbacteria bacterium RIFCSPLOWO2_01_FULL_35_13 TaxID=1802055 RepID=A0A1F7I7S8_9BACT|nr:MAG: hypothetical protein A2767_00790 [Candidatus Roizmanbacteria bacterium RIFCSPHIGHO2_01_FULL_35_10]OGK39430.1 MAG: hypothetical protein A3A74_04875 [Candidatus Roizmanbacteria bacterium RIFCSPLOWO2_01_FULL_35_13]
MLTSIVVVPDSVKTFIPTSARTRRNWKNSARLRDPFQFCHLFLFLIIGYFLLFSVQTVEAKVLPRFRSSPKKSTGISSGVAVSPRLRSDRKAINVNFNNLNKAKSVTYTLIYQTNGRDEGIRGSIDSSAGNSTTRELLFGTCSSGVCRYHANISSMRLEIETALLNGKRTLKRFKIRV